MVAFLLNASFIAGAVELYRHNDYITGSIVTFFELGWYSGNIYSAVSSAHKYNERVQNDFIQTLKANSALSIQRDSLHPSNYLLTYSLRF